MRDLENSFQKLETAVLVTAEKIESLKQINKEQKSEINELKRLLALSEKKAERLKQELDEIKAKSEEHWQVKEKDIKDKLLRLSAKISAFENSYNVES